MTFLQTDGNHPDFHLLCRKLDEMLDELAGGAQQRAPYQPFNMAQSVQAVLYQAVEIG